MANSMERYWDWDWEMYSRRIGRGRRVRRQTDSFVVGSGLFRGGTHIAKGRKMVRSKERQWDCQWEMLKFQNYPKSFSSGLLRLYGR